MSEVRRGAIAVVRNAYTPAGRKVRQEAAGSLN